jgi:hypothetical protein
MERCLVMDIIMMMSAKDTGNTRLEHLSRLLAVDWE